MLCCCVFCHLSKFISTVVPVEAPAAEVVITVSKGSAAADRMTVGAVVLTLPPEAASWPPLHVVEATTLAQKTFIFEFVCLRMAVLHN